MIIKVLKIFILWSTMASIIGCGRSQDTTPSPQPPAQVHNAEEESNLTTLTLTPQAEERLGIETEVVELRTVEKHGPTAV